MKKRLFGVLLLSCLLLTSAPAADVQEVDWLTASSSFVTCSVGTRGRVNAPNLNGATSTANEKWYVDGDSIRITLQSKETCEFEAVSPGIAYLYFECDWYYPAYDSELGQNVTKESHYSRAIQVQVTAELWTVSFDANGGSVSESSRSVTDGFVYGELPVPVRPGYAFDGWYTAATDGTRIGAMDTVTGDITLYAHWHTVRCAISFDADSGTDVTVTVSGNVDSDASLYVTACTAEGKFLTCAIGKAVTGENKMTLSANGAAKVTAFLLDADMRPLCAPATHDTPPGSQTP
ncbi:MAG: InlB B-repeat-containing protein [Oscillibacter sp.]|nr:InlB B-repeat-containing protein [Oscillibacter sp.]